METYKKEYRILASDVDPLQRLRPSRLFTFLQEAAIAHTEALGYGRKKTLDRGFLWVLSLQEAHIKRMPVYDENILLESLPGEMMHAFYPRYYRVSLPSGEELLTASALWLLMDSASRTMVFPQTSGVDIPGGKPLWETYVPLPPKLPASQESRSYTVPNSSLDINGHMNNARFLDLAEDIAPVELLQKPVKLIRVEYSGEAKRGENILLKYDLNEKEIRVSGASEKRLFRIAMQYE